MSDRPDTTKPFIPSIGATELAWLLAALVPAERKAMAEIADSADILNVDGETWPPVPVTSQETLDTLAEFASDGEDRENDLDDEHGEDDDRANDNPADRVALDEDMEPDDEPEQDDHSGSNVDAHLCYVIAARSIPVGVGMLKPRPEHSS